jgi:hypothetical protein
MIKKSVKIRCLGVYPRPIFFAFWFDSNFLNSFLETASVLTAELKRCRRGRHRLRSNLNAFIFF